MNNIVKAVDDEASEPEPEVSHDDAMNVGRAAMNVGRARYRLACMASQESVAAQVFQRAFDDGSINIYIYIICGK